ncbi:MAG: TonB-dependent receptor domain-containing protein, partial [Burkholderiales bacterium]
YEDYDEFDTTTDYKISARYQFTDSFAMRATANTGFRSPTPGQVNTLNVTTTSNSEGELVINSTFPGYDPIAVELGAVPLVPEESESYTVGLVWTPSDTTSVTVDYYRITIDNRVVLDQNFMEQDDVDALIAAGIPVTDATRLLGGFANFFVNGFDSEVSGIDVAVSRSFSVGGGQLLVDGRTNFNEQKVSNVASGTLNESRVYDLENQVPQQRSTLTLDYSRGDSFSGLLRFNYYGDWSSTGGLFSPGDASDQSDYGSTVLVDLEARFTFGKRYTVAIGGENIFDELPDPEQDGVLQFLGVRPALTSPFGFNGAFYYARASVKF